MRLATTTPGHFIGPGPRESQFDQLDTEIIDQLDTETDDTKFMICSKKYMYEMRDLKLGLEGLVYRPHFHFLSTKSIFPCHFELPNVVNDSSTFDNAV